MARVSGSVGPSAYEKRQVANVEMDGSEHNVAMSCEYQGARFHIWLDRKTLKPQDSVLYKNPLEGAEDQFETRTLDHAGALGRIVVPAMLAKVKELTPGFLANVKYKQDEQDAINEDSMRTARVERAAQSLFEALRYAVKDLENFVNAEDSEGRVVAPDSVFRKRLALYRTTLASAEWQEGK